jgi:hypothetical protein
MQDWIKRSVFVALILFWGLGCGKDDKSSAQRDAELQKALQEGAQKERQMYEGMQKGVENLEKEQKAKTK